MTFGKKPEINFSSSNFVKYFKLTQNFQTPLLEDNVTSKVKLINEKVFELNKITEDIKDFNSKLSKMEMKDFATLKPNM